MKNSERIFSFGSFYENNLVFDFLNLVQICEIALVPGAEISAHKQVCHEITYIVSGSGIFCTGDVEFEVGAGDIHVIAKGDVHRITVSDTNNLRYICIGFGFGEVPEKYREICGFYEKSPNTVSNCNSDLRSLFDMLIGEFYILQNDRGCVISELLKLILAKVKRSFEEDARKKQAPERTAKKQSTVYKILKYIDDNIYSVKTVGEISRNLHYTESYISAVFRQKMGITLQTYIRQKKLESAKLLLEYGNLTVSEISGLMHFESVQSFSKAFKKSYGLTPHRYVTETRKNSRAGDADKG